MKSIVLFLPLIRTCNAREHLVSQLNIYCAFSNWQHVEPICYHKVVELIAQRRFIYSISICNWRLKTYTGTHSLAKSSQQRVTILIRQLEVANFLLRTIWQIFDMIYKSTCSRSVIWGRFKNAYELLNLKAPKISALYKIASSNVWIRFFCGILRETLECYTQSLTHILKYVYSNQRWKFKGS